VFLEAQCARSADPVPFGERLGLRYTAAREGDHWGDVWDSAWFHLTGTVPDAWKGSRVVARLDFSGEGLVYSDAGVPVQGISNGSVFARKRARDLFPLFDSARGGERVDLWVEAAANGLFGANREPDPPRNEPLRAGSYEPRVNAMRLCTFDEQLWHLWVEMDLLNSLMRGLESGSVRRARILKGLGEVVDAFADDAARATDCRRMLEPLLESPAHASALCVSAVGHAHLDTAWLWPVREGARKAARTFATQIGLIERYPDFIFGASQPQHYAFVKEQHPLLYAKVRKAVADGRWEPQGGMWVECDCNIISGESMVRQFVHGKNFFKDEFGVDVRTCWIPDVFGYSASMPQIMRRSGVEYFLTQKISWSQVNRFPYHTFRWRGIDGSEVLTHFPPENTYNSQLSPKGLMDGERRFNERDTLDEFMSLFGTGDGGGGPHAHEIERAVRMANLEGAPRVRFGTAERFFDRIAQRAAELPSWVGELYLELHRGTYTTQARTKRGNRKLELKLRQAEYLCAMAPLETYPRETLDGLWKALLINQFHDILPGSSIGWVYHQTEREYADALATCDELMAGAASRTFESANDSLAVVNTLSYPYHGLIRLPDGWQAAALGGEVLPSQREEDGTSFAAVDLPAHGMATLTKAVAGAPAESVEGLVLENDLIRYEFDEDGVLRSAFDKECGREVLAPHESGNVITLYEDRPVAWDAWDIDVSYEHMELGRARVTAVERLGAGPVRRALRFAMAVGASTLVQEVVLQPHSKRLDFVTTAEWRERHRMLRVAFPVDVASESASFDIPYGFVRRGTHRNTSWDHARFEVCAQRYADLSDGGYGVALLNDCKYGYKILDHTIELNLLRSPTSPHGDADQGAHAFTYSLLPHAGSLVESDVMAEAAALNAPPAVFEGYAVGEAAAPCTVEGAGVSLEVVKKAEKEECLVVRLVETRGRHVGAVVKPAATDAAIVETNLTEWTDEGRIEDGAVMMRPFDIRTFKIV
jgi:alpha-mannosidase